MRRGQHGQVVWVPDLKTRGPGLKCLSPLYIPNSINVALGIGNCALGSYCLAVTQAKHCIVFVCPMPNCQWPIEHFHDGVIYYNYQNPLVFCFLMLIRAFCYFITYRAKLLDVDWLRQRAFFLNFPSMEGKITRFWLAERQNVLAPDWLSAPFLHLVGFLKSFAQNFPKRDRFKFWF